jgi:hypothetical protein
LISGTNNADAGLFQVSADGNIAAFVTDGALLPADTDTRSDVYVWSAGVLALASIGTSGGNSDLSTANVTLRRVSSDGSRVLFDTREPLVSADADGQGTNTRDLYLYSGGPAELVSIGPAGGSQVTNATLRRATPDLGQIVFETNEGLVGGDADGLTDVYSRTGATTALLTPGSAAAITLFGASRDLTRIAFATTEALGGGDGDSNADVYERTGGAYALLSTGPAGGNGDFDITNGSLTGDGNTLFLVTAEKLTAADTDAGADAYARVGSSVGLASTGPTDPQAGVAPQLLQFGFDGELLFATRERLMAGDLDASRDVYLRDGSRTRLLSAEGDPPETSITGGPSGTIDDPTPAFAFSADEAGSTFECRLDAAPFGACSGPGASHGAAALADGPHTFEVRATDNVGNPDASPAARAFTVDTTPDVVPPPPPPTDDGACDEAKRKLAKAKAKLKKLKRKGATAGKIKRAKAKVKKAKASVAEACA